MTQQGPSSEHSSQQTPTSRSNQANGAEREQRRQRILQAAMALFVERGFDAATMAEIAKRADVAVGTLYKFFADKRDLYQTMVANTMRQFERELVAEIGRASCRERV